MASFFQINSCTPIHEAYPDVDMPPVLDAGEFAGEVRPHRSRPRLVRFGRKIVSACGLAWWWQFFPGGLGQVSQEVEATIYDPTRGWVTGSGVLSAPTVGEAVGPSLYADLTLTLSGFDSGSEVAASVISYSFVYVAGVYVEWQ